MIYSAKFVNSGEVIFVDVESNSQLVIAAAHGECEHKIGDGEIEYAPAAIASFMAGEISRLEAMAVAQ